MVGWRRKFLDLVALELQLLYRFQPLNFVKMLLEIFVFLFAASLFYLTFTFYHTDIEKSYALRVMSYEL